MAKSVSHEDQVDAIVDDFMARLREGQKPQVDQYLSLHPDLADELADVLSAVLMVEDAQAGSAESAFPQSQPALIQLGDYRIVREIGRGGMGIVYEAVEEALGRRVALKLLPGASTAKPDQLLRFRREARAAARLEHPHIVPVYGIGQDDGQHYIAMQFVVGYGLDRVIAELKRQDQKSPDGTPVAVRRESGESSSADPSGVQSQERSIETTIALAGDSTASGAGSSDFYRNVARIAAEAAEALHYAHTQRIIHRDIKPSNLLLDVDGRTWVTDFGLAKLETDDNLTQTGDIVGTIRYMAPERLKGWADPTSDIYSLGLTLYELVTLQPAFVASDRASLLDKVAHESPLPPRKVNDRIPRDLETIILKASARENAQRYQTSEDLAADLRSFQEGKPILARPTPWREQAWLWSKRNPLIAGLAMGLAASLVIGLAAVSWNLYRLGQVNAALTVRNTELNAANLQAQENADEAEARFRDALAAVDEFLTKVADKHLVRTPGAQELRAELLNSALRFYRDYITSHQDDSTVQMETARAWWRVAQITDMIGTSSEAMAAANRGLPIAKQVHASIQSDETAMLLAKVRMQCGAIEAKTGRSDEAAAHYRASVLLLREIDEASSKPESQRLLADALGASGIQNRKQSKLDEAMKQLQESIQIAKDLVAQSSEDRVARETMALSYGNLANILVDSNRPEEALKALQQARAITRELLEFEPANIGFKAMLKSTAANEAVMYARQGRFELARPLAEESVRLSEQMMTANPGVNEYKADAAQQYLLLAAMQGESGDPNSQATRDLARPLLEGLLAEDPSVLRYRLNLAALHNDSGTYLMKHADGHEAALDRYAQSRDIAERILVDDPQNAMASYLLSIVGGGTAGCLDKLQRYEEALEAIERALKAGVAGRPNIEANFRSKHAQILAHLARREESVTVLEQLDESKLPPDSCYKAASAWACCAGLLSEDAAASDTAFEDYLDRSMTLLIRSRDGGSLNSENARKRFHENTDFDAIRQEPLFTEFEATLDP
jgi:eukaryotic-like serine/threonine-protein kinase